MKGVFMSRQDLLARIRRLDPELRFDGADEPFDAVFGQVLAKSRAVTARRRVLGLSRAAVIAAAAIGVVLLLPALAVGTGSFHLLGQPTVESTPVNGLLAAKGADGLYVVDPKSGGMLALKGTQDLDHPVWSPDARFLAVEKKEKGVTSVYTVWPNGTHAQLILENATAPAWSDDGTRVFVQRDTCTATAGCESSEEDTTVVYSVAADGSDAHQVSDDDYNVSQPGWPPGQNVLAFLAQEGSRDTGGLPTSVDSSEATWSPDGAELAIADTPRGIWVVNDDGTLRLIAKGAFSSLSWGTERAPGSPSASTRAEARSARR
jgi:dipeptidyl aminopeptidase/acylaminoacyl peptidase